jgi:hypothetical protein
MKRRQNESNLFIVPMMVSTSELYTTSFVEERLIEEESCLGDEGLDGHVGWRLEGSKDDRSKR